MTNPLTLKLEQRDRLSDEEKRVLDGAIARISTYARGEDMVREGEWPTESKLLLEGFSARYNLRRSGRRQITAIYVTGDFVDLHSFVIKKMDHSVLALSPCRVAHVPHETLREITERHPHLTRLLWLHTALDAALHRQWLVTMGTEEALGQTAHLICELFLRLQVVGQTEGTSFRLPVTQAQLADTLGISLVHVNRIIQELRRLGPISWRGDLVEIKDWKGLARLADFDPAFLNLVNKPR